MDRRLRIVGRNLRKPVFDFRSHFCHSGPWNARVSVFRLRVPPKGQKWISYECKE